LRCELCSGKYHWLKDETRLQLRFLQKKTFCKHSTLCIEYFMVRQNFFHVLLSASWNSLGNGALGRESLIEGIGEMQKRLGD
jgi:hypothetical protein